MAVFPLKILTPDGVAFDGSVSAVSCRTINGQIQLLAKHIDYCTALGMGEAHITLEDGTIRRFGASIKHQRTGWKHNAMVAWIIDPALADEAGTKAAEHPRISFFHSFLPK